MFFPVQFKTVKTDHILQIHQNHHQRVQLISQPKVCEANMMKWSCHHSELWRRQQNEGDQILYKINETRSFHNILIWHVINSRWKSRPQFAFDHS